MPEQLDITEADIRRLAAEAPGRLAFWSSFLQLTGVRVAAEVGVYRGDFAAHVLDECGAVERYYMIDPWRHLDDWNKPANKSDDTFERFLQEVLDKTSAHASARVLLRGRTREVADQIREGELDFVYIDGDHTLRGITTDLLTMYAKVRPGGFVGGDDFCRSIFQHSAEFEPTLVFPYAVHFAEAVGVPIYALPHKQFLIHKRPDAGYSFVDTTGRYRDTTLKSQIAGRAHDPQRSSPVAAEPRSASSSPPGRLTGLARRFRLRVPAWASHGKGA